MRKGLTHTLMFSNQVALGRLGLNADTELSFVHTLELHQSINQRENREITTHLYVATRVELRAALANQNHAWLHQLTTEALHAQSFTIAISSVPGTTRCLL